MHEKTSIRIIPLGGLDEVGKNMTAFEYKNEIIVVDAGIAFPDSDMYGVNVVIPEMEYLRENKEKVKKLIITHGHEDHIGAIPYFLQEFDVNVYATKLTTALIRNKLKGQAHSFKNLKIVDKDSSIKGLHMDVEFFETNHSIPDSVGIVLKTPLGNIVHTSDFKIDYTPIDGKTLDYSRIGDIKKEGVFLLLSDSTNALKEGFSPSEEVVAGKLYEKISKCQNRVIATTFASSLYRIQSLITIAERTNRKVVPIGRSMKNNIKTALKLDYLKAAADTVITDKQMGDYDENEILVITTGSQGEPTSALRRMVQEKNPLITLCDKDTVLFSSHSIPGNEKSVNEIINDLCKKGVEVHMGGDIHTSGHGYQEEIKLMLSLFKPEYFMPVHGEYRMLKKHAEIAEKIGVKRENIFICEIGDVVELNDATGKKEEKVKAGSVMVDESGMGDVEYNTLKDRERLANHGVVVVQIKKTPRFYKTRVTLKGVVAAYDRKSLYRSVNSVVEETMKNNENNVNASKRELYRALGKVLDEHLNRKPLIVLVFD